MNLCNRVSPNNGDFFSSFIPATAGPISRVARHILGCIAVSVSLGFVIVAVAMVGGAL